MGETPHETICAFLEALGENCGSVPFPTLKRGEALVWIREDASSPVVVEMEPGPAPIRRHRRKYAQGELGPDNSFYFRGPENRLNLRAQNLEVFLDLAQGVDDDTWMY